MHTEFANIHLKTLLTSPPSTWAKGWADKSKALAEFINTYGCNDTFYVKADCSGDKPVYSLVEIDDSLIRFQAYKWMVSRSQHDGRFVAAVIPESNRVGQAY